MLTMRRTLSRTSMPAPACELYCSPWSMYRLTRLTACSSELIPDAWVPIANILQPLRPQGLPILYGCFRHVSRNGRRRTASLGPGCVCATSSDADPENAHSVRLAYRAVRTVIMSILYRFLTPSQTQVALACRPREGEIASGCLGARSTCSQLVK